MAEEIAEPRPNRNGQTVAFARFEVSLHSLLPLGKTPEQLSEILFDLIAAVYPPEFRIDLEVELTLSTPLGLPES